MAEWQCAGFENQWEKSFVGSSPTPTAMFNFFKKNKKETKSLKEVLANFKDLEKNFDKLSEEMENFKKENKFSIQQVGIVRFNPFSEVGGDQSFSIALLDGKGDGVVITSLYTREGNRVYGKPIKNGKSEYLLSKEEQEAINQAHNALCASVNKAKYENKNSKLGNSTAGSGGSGSY